MLITQHVISEAGSDLHDMALPVEEPVHVCGARQLLGLCAYCTLHYDHLKKCCITSAVNTSFLVRTSRNVTTSEL